MHVFFLRIYSSISLREGVCPRRDLRCLRIYSISLRVDTGWTVNPRHAQIEHHMFMNDLPLI